MGTSAREAFREAFRKGFREAIAGWFNRGDRVRNPAELERPPRTEASVYGDIHYHPAPNPAPPTAGGAPDTSDDRATV